MADEIVTVDESTGNESLDKGNVVDLEAYERTKNDMHKFKRQYLETQEQLNKLNGKLEELETSKLKDQNNYKELWEKEKLQKEDLLSKYSGFKNTVMEDRKMAEIKEQALKSGLDPDFLELLDAFDTSDVIVEKTDSGKFIVNGADTYVETLKSQRPKLFKRKSDPYVNSSVSTSEPREKLYTPSDLLKLEKDDPAKYSEVITKKRHLIKTK